MGLVMLLAAAVLGAAAVGMASRQLLSATGPRALDDFLGTQARPNIATRVGAAATRRLPPLTGWRARLHWAHLNGALRGWSVEMAVGIAAIGIAFGLILFIVSRNLALLIAGGIVAAYPFVQIHAESEAAKRSVRRILPEVAAVIAAELAAGSSPERAIVLASSWPGPFGALMREVLAESQRTGRVLFSRGNVRGALVEYLSALDPALASFASQIDLVAAKGAEGAGLMISIADTLAQEHYGSVLIKAEDLDNELTVPAVVFFYLPLLALIVVPLVLSVLRVL